MRVAHGCHLIVFLFTFVVSSKVRCDEKCAYESKTLPKPISRTDGGPEGGYYFQSLSDVETDDKSSFDYFQSITNKSKTFLLTAKWVEADLFGRRISPGGCVENLYASENSYLVKDKTKIKYGEALNGTVNARIYLENLKEDKKQGDALKQNEQKRNESTGGDESVRKLSSRISANLDYGKTRFDFIFHSTLDFSSKSVSYEASLNKKSTLKSVAFAMPGLAPIVRDHKPTVTFKDAGRSEEYGKLYQVIQKNDKMQIKVVSPKNVRFKTVSVYLVSDEENDLIASGRVTIHFLPMD